MLGVLLGLVFVEQRHDLADHVAHRVATELLRAGETGAAKESLCAGSALACEKFIESGGQCWVWKTSNTGLFCALKRNVSLFQFAWV